MRLALISDIHGNRLALEAVLADIEHSGVDRVICLGDVATLGPCPGEVIHILQDLGCPCITGNHDAFLLDPPLIDSYTQVPSVLEAVAWCRRQLSSAELDFLKSFVPSLQIPMGGGCQISIFHGTPRSYFEDLLAATGPEEVDQMLAGHQDTLIGIGHTHIQMLRQHRGRLLVNPGSVGLPFKEYTAGQAPVVLPHAEYAIVDANGDAISVDLRRVALDKGALCQVLEDSTYPLAERLLEHYGD